MTTDQREENAMTVKTRPRCPNCEQPMVAGFMLNPGERRDAPSIWAEGELWQYMLYGGKAHPIVTYRCPGCGCLQSYAFEATIVGNREPDTNG